MQAAPAPARWGRCSPPLTFNGRGKAAWLAMLTAWQFEPQRCRLVARAMLRADVTHLHEAASPVRDAASIVKVATRCRNPLHIVSTLIRAQAYRMYTEQAFQSEMLPTSVPEIQRTNLGMTCLTLKVPACDCWHAHCTMSNLSLLEDAPSSSPRC